MHLPSRRCTCAAKDSIPRPSWARSAHQPIPSLVICELLGVPYADRASFQHRTTRLIDLSTPLDERLALGTLALLTHPDQLAVMRDDPDAGAAGVEELLRYLSIVHTVMLRQTTTEVEAAGVHIPAGRLVVLSLPSGNRDPAFIDDPDTLDISRGVPGHLAFGHGIHHCIGARLARMEMCVALPALLRRFPDLALAEPFTEARFRTFFMVYGLAALQVTW